jgi:hypothetical protein
MSAFFPVFGLYPPGFGVGKIRAGSVEGDNAPPKRFGEEERRFGHHQFGDRCLSANWQVMGDARHIFLATSH